ncbi:hypothetical protein L6452_35580 [Arctium lappa]|uniref:Uncharacterized protein n=1 Tax=Arctium lappa TaxID=4217 RepID=A0ACB8Y7H1_ARCLA|nr:hypothetical protein L6452_35580 [Arctium lappa]
MACSIYMYIIMICALFYIEMLIYVYTCYNELVSVLKNRFELVSVFGQEQFLRKLVHYPLRMLLPKFRKMKIRNHGIIPDMLKNAPMFKRLEPRIKNKSPPGLIFIRKLPFPLPFDRYSPVCRSLDPFTGGIEFDLDSLRFVSASIPYAFATESVTCVK